MENERQSSYPPENQDEYQNWYQDVTWNGSGSGDAYREGSQGGSEDACQNAYQDAYQGACQGDIQAITPQAPYASQDPLDLPAQAGEAAPQHLGKKDPKKEQKGFMSGFLEIVFTMLMGLGLALLLRAFVVESYVIPSGSMLYTLQLGDRLIGEKVSYYFRDPEPGEIVTFKYDDGSGIEEILIKRVIAVAGQTIDLVDGEVYVDGKRLDEPYTGSTPTYSLSDSVGSAGISYPYTVPEGCVWVMGDNRTNSSDSRFFGPISVDDVTSHAIFIFWPIGNSKTL